MKYFKIFMISVFCFMLIGCSSNNTGSVSDTLVVTNTPVNSVNIKNVKVTSKPKVKATKSPKKKSKKTKTGYIYVGDSRFVGMESACGIDNGKTHFVVAKVSMGYKWLMDTALSEVKQIQKNHKDITSWKLIIGLGVNDLYNKSKYISTYKSLASDYDLYLVSVNSIEYHKSLSNKDVKNFNKSLKKVDKVKYIDTYSHLISKGYSTTDGLHYTNDTYKKIFEFIDKNIDNK